MLVHNLELDLEDPEVSLRAAFTAHDFPCVAALLNAGVRFPEEGYELQELLTGLEEGATLDDGAAKVITRSILNVFAKEDICQLPLARNAIYVMCQNGFNEAIGAMSGMASMSKTLLQAVTQNPKVDKDLAETVLEAIQDDFFDTPDMKHADLFFTQLIAFDPDGKAIEPLAKHIATQNFASFNIWGERPYADNYTKPSVQDMSVMMMTLTSTQDEAQTFKQALAHALNPDMEAGSILLDMIEFAKKYWLSHDTTKFDAVAEKIIEKNLTIDDLSRMVSRHSHLETLAELGVKTDSLNKSLLRASVLTNILESDLGL